MIQIKTPGEIEIITEAGKILAKTKEKIRESIQSGITLIELDRIAQEEIEGLGGEPAFKKVPGYKWTTCINVGDGVVHGIPNNYEVGPGDKVSVDVGVYLNGFYTDSAFTVGISPVSEKTQQFIDGGLEALEQAMKEVKPGNRIGHVSKKIEDVLRSHGFSPVYMFTGHGVGRELHEEPAIPCFLTGGIENTPLIKEGMVLAIEPIYTEGGPEIVIEPNGWTARTRDGKMGGLFEETVVVESRGPQIVTRS